jgi:hypothetical protein
MTGGRARNGGFGTRGGFGSAFFGDVHSGRSEFRYVDFHRCNYPVTWQFTPLSNASWLSLTDNGDGTAQLFGTPPLGTTGTFSPFLGAAAYGTIPIFKPYPVTAENIPGISQSALCSPSALKAPVAISGK